MKLLSRKSAFQRFSVFPKTNLSKEKFSFPKVVGSENLIIKANSFEENVGLLTEALTSFLKESGSKKIWILGDAKTPWRFQENEFPPVAAALAYLTKEGVKRSFNGAIGIKASDFEVFLPHLIWLTRCNAALPQFYFTTKKQQFIGHICQYGTLHIHYMTKKAEAKLSGKLAEAGFKGLETAECGIRFPEEENGIEGRQLMI